MRASQRVRLLVAIAPLACGVALAACSWDVGKIFDRDDPQVEQARAALEASIAGGDADLQTARADLEEVLRYRCEADGGKDLVIDRPNASLDLGLVIFRISELIGRRFGEEEKGPDSGEEAESIAAARTKELDCAHLLLRRIANDPATPLALKLRAHYLLGNFEFLSRHYQNAIDEYDHALIMHPGRGIDPQGEVGAPQDDDAVARDAAWNRAIALERLHDKDDAGNDADADGGDGDGGDGDSDASDGDGSDSDGNDGNDASDSKDAGSDGDSGPDSGAPDTGGDTGNEGKDTGGDGKRDDQGDTAPSEGGADAGQDTQVPQSPSSQPPPPPGSNTPPPVPSGGVDLRELDRFDKKSPIDLDLPAKLKERKKLPKGMDK